MVRPHGEGIDNRLMPEGMGLHGTDHAHLVFERAPVPVANRLGEEGQGLEVALAGFLVPSRISLAMSCVGLAQRALDLAVAVRAAARDIRSEDRDPQAVAFRLAEMATDIEAARRLVLHAADTWERDHGAVAESAMAKLFASEMLQRVTDSAINVHGGLGYFQSPIERVYRDARAQRFEEGTVEIQKMTIARDLLRYAVSAGVWQPGQIGPLQLPHRIVMGSMHLGLEGIDPDGSALADFYRARAEGGAALIVTGGSAVSRVGAGGRNYSFIGEDADAGKLGRVAAAVHEPGHGCCCSCSTPGATPSSARSG